MANNTETTAVKIEFVDVLTEGELLSSPISATFSTIVTEASLVEVPPTDGPLIKKPSPPSMTECSLTPYLIGHSPRTN